MIFVYVMLWICIGLYIIFFKVSELEPIKGEDLLLATFIGCLLGPFSSFFYIFGYIVKHDNWEEQIDSNTWPIIKEAILKLIGEEPKNERSEENKKNT